MTSEWHEVPLRELVGYISKGIAPSYAEEASETTIRVLNQKCNRNFRISYGDSRLHDTLKKKVPPERYVKPDDILINSTGAGTAGRIAQIEDVPSATTIDGHMILIRSNGKVTQKFLGYALKAHQWEVLQLDEGSTGQTELNRDRLLDEIMINYPVSFDEQNAIVGALESIDRKLIVNKEINDNLRQQAQALFKKWFVDNPDAILWKEGTFSNLIEKTISGDWGKDSPSGNNTEMVYCIRGADIPEVRAGNKGKMPTRYILPKNYAAKQLVDGDIVVEISGGSPTQSTGRAAAVSDALLARYDKGMVCTNFCKALKPRAGYSMYVYYYWQYLYDRDIFFSYENGTTGIKNLDINGFIETEPIVIAPEDLVEKFDAVCQTVFSKIYANGMENEQLALVRDTILPKLMSGEIDVSAVQL